MELWDIYDDNRNLTGRTIEREAGRLLTDGEYHLVVCAWIRNSRGEFLLSRRHPDKPCGLFWETPGGAVTAGEDSLQGVLREAQEEVGLTLDPARGRLFHTERRDHGFFDDWIFFHDTELSALKLQPEEVVDAKWALPEEIVRHYENGEFLAFSDYFRGVFDIFE